MKNNSVVVLLSAYNGEKYIETQIESIINQQGIENLNLIIRNDGSNDGTGFILSDYKKKYNNIEIIDGSNIGIAASCFELLKYAVKKSYDYYAFSDQDDYWMPDKLTTAVCAMKKESGPCMYSSCSTITDEELNPTGGITQKKIRDICIYNSAVQNICPGHNQVINLELAKLILENTVYSEDIYSQDLWITNVAALTGNIVFDNNPHTLYRQHSNNKLMYGKGRLHWIIAHLKRLKNKEGCKICRQLQYFVNSYRMYLTFEQSQELYRFLSSQRSFIERCKYINNSKLYRQKKSETALFKIIYLFGGYNI